MQENIHELIAKSHSPRITDYFSQGFNIVFKKPLAFILFTIFFLAAGILASYIPIINIVYNIAIQPLLLLGLYIAADRINYLEDIDSNTFFNAFRSNTSKVIVANLLMVLMMVVPIILLAYGFIGMVGVDNLLPIAEDRPDDINVDYFDFSATNILVFLAGFFLLAYLGISYMFALHMIWFKDLAAWRALEASRKLVAKHFLHFILFILFAFVVNLAGALLLGVGLLVTIPATYCAMYVAFDDLVKARELNENDQIIDHFIS